MQGKQSEPMAVMVEGDQAAFQQLLPVVFKNLQKCLADDLGSRTLHPELDHAGQTCPSQREDAREVQILGDDDRLVVTGVIEDCVIRVANFADVPPVGGGDASMNQEIVPARREVLVDD